MSTPQVIGTLTTDTSTVAFPWNGSHSNDWFANLQVFGTFDSATVTIEASLDGTNWTPIDNGEFTEPLLRTLRLKNCSLRATMTDAGASSSVTVQIT